MIGLIKKPNYEELWKYFSMVHINSLYIIRYMYNIKYNL